MMQLCNARLGNLALRDLAFLCAASILAAHAHDPAAQIRSASLPLTSNRRISRTKTQRHEERQQTDSSLGPGSVAPDFALPDLNGRQVRLRDLHGKVVLLNFWAFWCDTWKDEMPQLEELARRQKDLNFQIVTISVDGARLPEFLPQGKPDLPFPVLLDVGGHVTDSYVVTHVPTVLLLDREGRIRFSCIAWPGNPKILNQLRKLASIPARTTKRTDTLSRRKREKP